MTRERDNILSRIDKINNQLNTIKVSKKELPVLYEKFRDGLSVPADVNDIGNAVIVFQQSIEKRHTEILKRLRANEENRSQIEKNRDVIKNAGPNGICPLCWKQVGDHYDDILKEYNYLLEENQAASENLSLELDVILADTHRVPALKKIIDRIQEIQILSGYQTPYEEELKELRENLGSFID